MNDDRVFQLLAEINPVPDPDGLDSPIALTDTEEMRGAMATIERTEHEQTTTAPSQGTSSKKGLMIAAVAAAVILIVGVGLWAFSSSGDTELVASTPAGLASTYLDARNDNDPEAALAVLSPTASLIEEVPTIPSLAELPGTFEWMSIRGIRFDHSCTETAPGAVSTVRCTYEGVDRLSTALDQPPFTGQFSIRINDGQIITVRNIFNFAEYSPNVFEVFVDWLDTEHPGAFDTIYRVEDGLAIGLTTPEALELLDGYIDEFEASRS